MNEKAIFEIGNLISVRRKLAWRIPPVKNLTPEQITKTYEYDMFKKSNPELCRLAEKDSQQFGVKNGVGTLPNSLPAGQRSETDKSLQLGRSGSGVVDNEHPADNAQKNPPIDTT